MRRFKEQPYSKDPMLPFVIINNGRKFFDRICFLNSNGFSHDQYSAFDWLIALGANNELKISNYNVFDSLKSFSDHTDDWTFGFLCYDVKNQIEKLTSSNIDNIKIDLVHFFQPVVLIICSDGKISLGLLTNSRQWNNHDEAWSILTDSSHAIHGGTNKANIKPRVAKSQYISNVKKIQDHIQRGDIYEMNYCVEFFDDKANIDPLFTYIKLNNLSPAPFSAFYRLDEKYLICSSPERFLKKTGNKIISQPIKGTIKRGNTPESDLFYRNKLFNDSKERSENVMIVDLVRNDLAKTAQKGSVKVEELFGIYAFAHVHHMISTITSHFDNDQHYIDVIEKTFPMGSMTGAPKIRAMEIIEDFESTRRSLYSGCIGYINPDKDFDFNVVIRSILYNNADSYVNFMVGGAITAGSEPEREYQECLLKAKAMIKALDSKNSCM